MAEYFDIGYGPGNKGATGNKGKQGAASRADRTELFKMTVNATDSTRTYDPRRDPALNPGKILKLGATEIERGDSQYTRPGIAISHGTSWAADSTGKAKGLHVTLHLRGRTGKQVNYNNIYRRDLGGDRFEIHTGGASKSEITLAEWQALIDSIDVRVADISRNTVGPLTPELEKMARDVIALRRKRAPSDAEWAAELKQSTAVAEPAKKDVVSPITGVVTQEAVIDFAAMCEEAAACELSADGYDAAWACEFLTIVSEDYFALDRVYTFTGNWSWKAPHQWIERTAGYRAALALTIPPDTKSVDEPAVLPQDLQAASDAQSEKLVVIRNGTELINPEWRPNSINGKHDLHYETNHGIDGKKPVPASINAVIVDRLLRTGGLTITGEMPEWVRELIREVGSTLASAQTKRPPVKSNEDVMTKALEAKYPIKPETIDGLVEAIEYAIKFPEKKEALTLTDGFEAVEVDGTLRIKHIAMPDINRTIGVKLASGVYGRAIQRGEVRALLLRLKDVNAKKREVKQTAPNGMKPISEVVAKVTKDVTPAVTHESPVTDA